MDQAIEHQKSTVSFVNLIDRPIYFLKLGYMVMHSCKQNN